MRNMTYSEMTMADHDFSEWQPWYGGEPTSLVHSIFTLELTEIYAFMLLGNANLDNIFIKIGTLSLMRAITCLCMQREPLLPSTCVY